MSKNFRVIDPTIRFTHRDFGFLKITVVTHLSDIQSAAELPNYRFEVANDTNGARGVIFMRVEGKFDSDKHDSGISAGLIEHWLREMCRSHGEALQPVHHSRLQYHDRGFMRNPMERHEPLVDELFSTNAKNILGLADTRAKRYFAPFVAPTGSMVMASTDKDGQFYHRFSLILDGDVRFHAAPTGMSSYGEMGVLPYDTASSMHPADQADYIKEMSTPQGTFQFQGREYSFNFSHLLFDTSLTKVFSKQLLERTLNDGLRKQFPFFQVQGMDFGASMLGLKFN